jgi:hypothetical protein
MKTEQLAIVSKATYGKLQEAKKLCIEFRGIELNFQKISDAMKWQAYLIGKILNELKEEIGHGKWLLYLTANLPELGDSDASIIRNAQRCMMIAKASPNARNATHLDQGAMRKFLWGYVPPKERMVLEGDSTDEPVPDPLTCVNYWHKWYRQVKTGQIEQPEVEELRHDIGPMLLEGVEMVGRDWFLEKLGGAVTTTIATSSEFAASYTQP